MKTESDKALLPQLKKERHIVSWTPEEDELLREQVTLHGIDNWTSISAQFKDKTSRQCRRRWYTYLNSEGKKGGWSLEEDMLLCEAQKIFGNRWTEIAKVVSGRTDNAVKNRFSTLCKKRTKHVALSKENNDPSVTTNNKRIIIQDESFMSGRADSSVPVKQIRYHILDHRENHNSNEMLPRCPLSVLAQNSSVGGLPTQYHCENKSIPAVFDESNKAEGSFLRKDDPKLTALLQQAEMLSSLALKVNSENTGQSLENAWKELNEYLIQNGGGSISADNFDMDFSLEGFKDLIDELKSSNTMEQSSWRQLGCEESRGSSEHSSNYDEQKNGTTTISNQNHMVICHQEDELDASISTSQEEPKESTENICNGPITEFDSPHQTVPTFKSLTEGIPTPNFSSSERQFLLNILSMSSPAPSSNSAQQPSCKRILLDSLR